MSNKERRSNHEDNQYHRAIDIINWASSKKFGARDYSPPELIGGRVRLSRKDPNPNHGLEISEQVLITVEDLQLLDEYIESELPRLDYDKNKAGRFIRAMAVINKVRRLLPSEDEG